MTTSPYYRDNLLTFYHGDVLDTLRQMPDESVQCVVTSPPYWSLRDYGVPGQLGLEPTPAEYVAKMVAVFDEVRRVLRSDGTCWLNLGDSFAGSTTRQNHNFNERCGNASGDRQQEQGRSSTPRGMSWNLKPKDLCMIPARVAIALQDAGWWLRSEITWCLSGGTKIYARTQKGDMPQSLKDLVRLDPSTVQLWDGEKWNQVVAWTPSAFRGEPLELELRSGEKIGCTPDHLWPTQRGVIPASELQVGDVIQTTRLPEPEDPDRPWALPDELVGWFVGMYLAEGHKDDKVIRLAGHQKELARFERCKEIAALFHGSANWTDNAGNGATISMYGGILHAILDTYVTGKGAKGKRLTNACWRRSDRFLRAILDGYLEGDGHWDEGNKRWRISFARNYGLADDLRTICARLGISIRLRLREAVMDGRKFPIHRGEIRFERSTSTRNRPDSEIVAIGRSRGRKFWDVSVESEPHLFALASGVLTHNCKRAPMPESVTDRPTSATEKIFLLTKSKTYFYDADAVRVPAVKGAAGSTFTDGKTGVNGQGRVSKLPREDRPGRNLWNYWLLSPSPYPDAHFATFPPELPRTCILAGTSERGACPACGAPWRRVVERSEPSGRRDNDATDGFVDLGMWSGRAGERTVTTTGWQPTCDCDAGDPVPCVVLDPFLGSGTTAMVAQNLGRKCIGIDLNSDYLDLAVKRCAQKTLWGMNA